jgi:hypothetical protein
MRTILDQYQLIRQYINIQELLLNEVITKLPPTASEFDFARFLPRYIVADGEKWSVGAHGVGILFENERTHEIVDAHEGMFDAKDAVDAWRLLQFGESVGICDTTFESWQETLNELSNLGQLEKHKLRKHHFVLPRTPQ